jgi:hypothetical protein
MYTVRNKVYAEAGCLLIGKSQKGYVFNGKIEDFSEIKITLEDMKIEGQFLVYSNRDIVELYNPKMTYEQLKAKYVKVQFSNDDQIAIMLNKGRSEEDDMLFDKMQQWRDWCGKLAKAIVNLK